MSDQPTTIQQSISNLSRAIGIAAAIFIGPWVYAQTKCPICQYLYKLTGPDLAWPLTWSVGAVEIYVIYAVVCLMFHFLWIWVLTAFAARSLGR